MKLKCPKFNTKINTDILTKIAEKFDMKEKIHAIIFLELFV